MQKQEKVLVSFIHPVGIMLEEHAVSVYYCICEEIFRGTIETASKVTLVDDRKTGETLVDSVPPHLPLDFPLLLRVISLADGKKLKHIYPLLVKYNNISAIMTLVDEQ